MKSQLTPPRPVTGEPSRDQTEAIWGVLAAVLGWAPGGAGTAPEALEQLGRELGLAPPAHPHTVGVEALKPDALARALRLLSAGSGTLRRFTLACALEAALASGTLTLAQHLVLRTVAEGLGLRVTALAVRFRDRTGAELPPLWDPGDPADWAGRDQGGPGPHGVWDDAQPEPRPGPRSFPAEEEGRIARIKALALLGLEEGASPEDIRRAFHRISKVHHPDHYLSLGVEAGRDATETFRRIKAAHDFLLAAP